MIKFIQKILGIATKERVDEVCTVIGALIHDVRQVKEDVAKLKGIKEEQ